MVAFWRLLFGHALADFTFQTDYISAWKRQTLAGMAAHSVIHPLVYAVLLWPFLGEQWIASDWFSMSGWQCLYLVFLAHFAEDALRVLAIGKYRKLDNTLSFVWDQLVHGAVIFLVIPLGTLSSGETGIVPERWPVIGVLLVAVTDGANVLLYYVEKDLYGSDWPQFWEKYLGMGERLVLCLLCMIPGRGWVLLASGWLWIMYHARTRRILDATNFNLVGGACVSLLCGLGGRLLLFN